MLVPYLQRKTPDWESIKEILKSSININHYTNNGPVKQELEKYLEKLLKLNNNKKIVCVTNATVGIHLLMMYYQSISSAKIRWGIPSFTFPSPIVGHNEKKITKDIDLKTYTLPFDKYDDCDGYIITNLFGTNCRIEELCKFCKSNNKYLIFDNASSPLTEINNNLNICNYGDACAVSLHHTKYLGYGEGGFVVVDEKLYDIINSMTNFGFNNARQYNINSSNWKMSDISASFILSHIKQYDINKHKDIQNKLICEINKINNVNIFNYSDGVIYGNLPIIFNSPIDSNVFKDIGIEANKYYKPLDANHINSNYLYERIINFPLNTDITDYQILLIIKGIKQYAGN